MGKQEPYLGNAGNGCKKIQGNQGNGCGNAKIIECFQGITA
nr:MAG TPA: hypothetical protein [Caudoviricetes sp.]